MPDQWRQWFDQIQTPGNRDLRHAPVKERFEQMLAPLPAQGYERSEIRGSDVCILSDFAALVTLDFARLRADDSVIGHYPSLWIVALIDGKWGVQARSSFAP